jgi:hypothetical protein
MRKLHAICSLLSRRGKVDLVRQTTLDSRPTVDNIWAAFTAAEWATQQKLDWSQRERVYEMLKKKDAEIKQRRTGDIAR